MVERLVDMFIIDYTYNTLCDEESLIILMSNDNLRCDIFIKINDIYYNVSVRRHCDIINVNTWVYDGGDDTIFSIAKYPKLAEFINREYPELTIELVHVIADEMKLIISKVLDDGPVIGGIVSKLKRKSSRE